MIKHLAAILKQLPEDMPQPRIEPNTAGNGLYLTWEHASNGRYARVYVVAADSNGTGVLVAGGWPRLTDTDMQSHSFANPTDIPAQVTELLNTFAQTVRESQREQVTA